MDKLEQAITETNLQKVRLLLAKGKLVQCLSNLLLVAAVSPLNPHAYEMVKLLLEHGADPNAQAPAFEYLSRHGSDIAKQTMKQLHWPALEVAVLAGSVEVVRLLLDHGADVSCLKERFRTVYGIANLHDPETARQKLQLLLRAGLPRDIPVVQETIKEHPWVLE